MIDACDMGFVGKIDAQAGGEERRIRSADGSENLGLKLDLAAKLRPGHV